MRVLLSDGSGLTARQTANQLADAGHRVEALSSDPFCLARFTRRVRRIHPVPAYGPDPVGWLDAALAIMGGSDLDVLFPTQEQVAVLSACADVVRAAGVRTIVPSFAALLQVQDKISAFATLKGVGLPQPDGEVLTSPGAVLAWDRLPIFLKLPIGTATSGVTLVRQRSQLAAFVDLASGADAFGDGGILAQAPVPGALAMLQTVFADGELVAFHANLRVREGARGGASHKCSIDLPVAWEHLAALGRRLGWHGALSADAILTADGPVYIDINPRLVEPGNARRAGVDLVTPLLELATGQRPIPRTAGRAGASTHQLLLAILGAAERTGRRRGVLAEVTAAARHSGDYRGSVEELTPLGGDPSAAVPVVLATTAALVDPRASRWFSGGSVRNYALTPAGWRQLRDRGTFPR